MVRRLSVLSLCAVTFCAVASAQPADLQGLTAFAGRPEVTEDSNLSYFIWRDGDRWHVRWTTWEHNRVFRGTVSATAGTLREFKRIDVEAELKVIRGSRTDQVLRRPQNGMPLPGYWPVVASHPEDYITRVNDRLIRWSTRLNEEIDGFSFRVEGVATLTFDLRLLNPSPTRAGAEVETRPRSVKIGRNSVRAESHPFTVTLK